MKISPASNLKDLKKHILYSIDQITLILIKFPKTFGIDMEHNLVGKNNINSNVKNPLENMDEIVFIKTGNGRLNT